ncbi:MAG: CoB--CoM heterodisulfide reductase iron-sulfur subunit A family protein [Chloroflexota bacterium]
MVSVGRHKNITLLTYSEVEDVTGVVGDFKAIVRKKARYVNEDLCTGCGVCVEKCPWKKIPDKFDFGLGNRPAIYFQYAQAVPKIPVIDKDNCAYFKNGKCKACEKFCQRDAIDFEQQDELLELNVGTIILATGFKDFDPTISPQYGYKKFGNVLTGREFERLINTGGPTAGAVQLPNGEVPRRIAVIHCVGSRGDQNEYCSRACCMYSLKLAHLSKDVLKADVYEFYRDMRTFGKGYEAFYESVREEDVQFYRYEKEIKIDKSEGGLVVEAVDVFTGKKIKQEVDMVVLSTGMEPQDDHAEVAHTFGVSRSPDGFFMERHPKLAPVETATAGVFLAGACQSPKDIPDSVAQGSAAAASAIALMDAGRVTLEPYTAKIDSVRCSGCKICLDTCPYNAISSVEYNGKIVSEVNEVTCKGCGTCVASCPAGAATQLGFNMTQIISEIDGILNGPIVQEVAV